MEIYINMLIINSFGIKCMQADPGKFQAIEVGMKSHAIDLSFKKVSDTYIKCEDVGKLLGVHIGYQLNFDQPTQ